MGHARALINIDDAETQVMIYNQVVKYGFSVRKVEEIVHDLNADDEKPGRERKKKFPTEYQNIKNQLDKIFRSRINFSMNEKGKGKIVIPFKSADDLERIIKIIESQ